MSREVTNKDLEVVDKAIADHAVFQKDLFVLQRILTEIGKLDVASVRRGVEAEQARLDDVRKQADAAHGDLTQLQKQIEDKRRELASVEATIAERTIAANQLNESYLKPMSDAEHRDWVYQMQERRMAMATPPSALQDMVAAEPKGFMSGVLHDNRAPTTPATIPQAQSTGGPANVRGTGWVDPAPLGPPPGLRYVDAQLDAQDAKDRAELVEREARLKAMEKMIEQTEIIKKQTEALAKLAEGKP
jgi:hypothetical protein